MRCIRCNSTRVIRFVDGFGQHRIFCKNCKGSFVESYVININQQKHLQEYMKIPIHDNPRAVIL